jgi:hypothetical protein
MGNTPDLAKQLFDEEVSVLVARATVKTFIDVIATRRVKQRPRKLQFEEDRCGDYRSWLVERAGWRANVNRAARHPSTVQRGQSIRQHCYRKDLISGRNSQPRPDRVITT